MFSDVHILRKSWLLWPRPVSVLKLFGNACVFSPLISSAKILRNLLVLSVFLTESNVWIDLISMFRSNLLLKIAAGARAILTRPPCQQNIIKNSVSNSERNCAHVSTFQTLVAQKISKVAHFLKYMKDYNMK